MVLGLLRAFVLILNANRNAALRPFFRNQTWWFDQLAIRATRFSSIFDKRKNPELRKPMMKIVQVGAVAQSFGS